MRKIILAAAMAIAVAGCSQGFVDGLNKALDAFDTSVQNFNAAADRIDASIAKTSPTLARYCDSAKTVGSNLVTDAGKSTAAKNGLVAVTNGINSYCTNLPTDIDSAITALVAAIQDGQAAYKSAKAGN